MSRGHLDLTGPGYVIAGAVAFLALVGLATIYVADTAYAGRSHGASNALRQLVFFVVGAGAAYATLRIGYLRIGSYAYVIFGVALVLLVPLLFAKLTHVTFGNLLSPRNGAYRWIRLPGFQVQPSELMKVAFIIALAAYLRYRRNYRRFQGLIVPFLVSGVPLVLILLEPDLGTVLLLVAVLFVMMYLAGAKRKHLLVLIAVGVLLAPVGWMKIKSYQRLRITAVLLQADGLRQRVIDEPERYDFLATKRQALEWAASSGYQLVASKRAVGSGGVFGRGWGKGVYVENKFLPDRHNDFIFALVAHQWGLVGCLVVLAAYYVIVLAGVRIASATKEPFGRMLAVGVVALIALQVVINIGMTIGLLPITGMTLPFISYGGSSLLTNFVALALLVSVSQYRPFLLSHKPFNYGNGGPPRGNLIEQTAPAPHEWPYAPRAPR
jgi:rod shape determining protein RodA